MPPDDTPELGEVLRRYRVAARLTQEELAERAGLSVRGLSDLERGTHRAPHRDTLQRLAEALSLDTGGRTTLLAAARQHLPRQGATAFAPARGLPVVLSSFVGREHHVAEVGRLLDTTRLLTLTGAGGIGKTRLALEVARDLADEVVFVDLVPLTDATLVPPTVAANLGVREQPQRSLLETLATALRTRRLLLILDNCEHLVSACADLADTLLRSCLQLRILATSREPLGIDGELVWPVPVLSIPDLQRGPLLGEAADSEAVRLFVERAQSAMPSFVLDEHTAHVVAELCVQLDGIPLAIELAAARVRALGASQLASRLADRFRLLAGGRRAGPRRHQTLRAAVDWSYDLLSAAEQRLFHRLAVFAGGWTLEAAEAVCGGEGLPPGDVLDLLARLVDKSLAVADADTRGAMRYRFLETIRQYADERLQLSEDTLALYQRHRDWYVALGQRALGDYWWGRDVPEWLDRLSQEQANVRVALRFALEHGQAEPGLRLAAGLWVLWAFRGSWTEGRDWIRRLLALPGAADCPGARADALSAAGQMAFQQGDYDAAQCLLAEAVDLQRQVGDPRGLAMAVTHAGLAARGRGQYAAARALHEEAVVHARAAGNRGYEATNLAAMAHAAYLQGEHEVARAMAQESLAVFNTMTSGMRLDGASIAQYVLGRVALATGDYPLARQHFEESLALWRATGDARVAPGALVGLGGVALAEGDLALARCFLDEALTVSEETGSKVGLVYTLEGCAILAAADNQPESALRLEGAAAGLRAAFEHPRSVPERALLERWLSPARRRLGDAAAAATSTAGAALSAEQAVACARALASAGRPQD